MPRAGIVTVVGKPNVGKSTLLNQLVGQKLSITSEKPQSTRDRIVGIHTSGDVQMILFDTPGLLEPKYELQRTMRSAALAALQDADVVLYLGDASDGALPAVREAARLQADPRAPVISALNKIDVVSADERARLAMNFPDAHLISARTGEGLENLMAALASHLPESPFLYPEEDIATQPTRFFASELIRETALEQLDEEVPYSVACAIEEFREDRSPVYIRATVFVERKTQKAILLGKGGSRIKEIGRASRLKIERLIDAAVYLDLWVKVLPNWRRDPAAMRRLGYAHPQDRTP
jgi:GTP-binding protein Era